MHIYLFKVRYMISYTMSVMQSTLLPLGRMKQQYKSQNGDEKVPICSNYRVEIGAVGIKNLEDLANRNSSVTVRTLIY